MTESELLKRFDEQSTADIGIFISQALTTFPGYDKFRIKSAQFYMQLGSYAPVSYTHLTLPTIYSV